MKKKKRPFKRDHTIVTYIKHNIFKMCASVSIPVNGFTNIFLNAEDHNINNSKAPA